MTGQFFLRWIFPSLMMLVCIFVAKVLHLGSAGQIGLIIGWLGAAAAGLAWHITLECS